MLNFNFFYILPRAYHFRWLLVFFNDIWIAVQQITGSLQTRAEHCRHLEMCLHTLVALEHCSLIFRNDCFECQNVMLRLRAHRSNLNQVWSLGDLIHFCRPYEEYGLLKYIIRLVSWTVASSSWDQWLNLVPSEVQRPSSSWAGRTRPLPAKKLQSAPTSGSTSPARHFLRHGIKDTTLHR